MQGAARIGGLMLAMAGALTALAQAGGGALVVRSEPSGATVEIDRRNVGTTPVRVSGLEPGDHAVVVAKDGYLENRRVVAVPESGAIEHRVVLVSLGGSAPPSRAETASADTGAEAGSDAATNAEPAGESRGWRARARRWAIPAAVAVVGGAGIYLATRNGAPVAEIRSIVPAADGIAGLTTFSFDGGSSSDPDGDSLSYAWDFGDGQSGTGVRAEHVYTAPGEYSATLTVNDGKRSTTTGGRAVTVVALSATIEPSGAGIAGLTRYTFSANPSTDPDGDALTFNWSFGDGGTASGTPAKRVYPKAGNFVPRLTARDPSSHEVDVALNALLVRSMAGSWNGQISGFGSQVELCMELTQTGTTITGSYRDEFGPGVVAGSVAAGPNVSLTVTQPGFAPFIMQGPASADLTRSEGTVLSYFTGGAGQYVITRSSGCSVPTARRDRSLRRAVR